MDFDIRVEKPIVSVSVITYNNEPYIRECLTSILEQKTDFPFEVCIGEDGSTDGTRDICLEFAEKYPDKIRLFLRTRHDVGRERFKSQGVYNYIVTTRECRGEFVAFCDGDDAWPDQNKLQSQYEVMRADEKISLVHSDYDSLNMVTGCRVHGLNRSERSAPALNGDKKQALVDLLLGKYIIAASSVFVRTADVLDIFENSEELFLTPPMGDTQTWCELLTRGDFYYSDEALALYRVVDESTSNSLSALKRYEFVNGTADLGLQLISRYDLPEKKLIAFKVKSCNRYAMLSGNIDELVQLHELYAGSFSLAERFLFRMNKISSVRAIFAWLFQKRYISHHLKR